MKGMVWLLIEKYNSCKINFLSLPRLRRMCGTSNDENSDHTSRRSREGQAVLVDEIGLQSADVGGVQVAVVKQHLRYVPRRLLAWVRAVEVDDDISWRCRRARCRVGPFELPALMRP
jgi:hypothetical protein